MAQFIDLRSDTVTSPSAEMRQCMASAPVGDDVMGEDPTVQQLEQYTADLFSMEAALFVPSGTMANQVAVRTYCGIGSEIAAVDESHLFFYEAASAASLSGTQIRSVPSINGLFDIEEFESRIRPDDIHFPETRLFWVENTHNRGGGTIVPWENMQKLHASAKINGIPVHVDGARIANAVVATGIDFAQWGSACDSISICLSKGLGAPVGSLVAGPRSFINECNRARKAFGGGMRQAGIIAAGGLYALKNNVALLSEDHRRACELATGINGLGQFNVKKPDTNIVMIDVEPEDGRSGQDIQIELENLGVRMYSVGPLRLRAVTHLDLDDSDIAKTIDSFRQLS